ncbi:putative sporulation protein (polysaccharide deacetylase family) [Neobacillus bataviensis]|uniref:Putative sporulation protein (Polysaccharide deacetylase family) n=1 Tax=Neobacillus bataviensis TaxID=220685 RepID=A0A561DZN4_9BACI|nr:polysaccharide deacetylase family protein [Neobacillus bataviensis]TWE08816.1 putative sporulation protein (polysaccharide deacetylase family) [Neobacillus bataviensis]
MKNVGIIIVICFAAWFSVNNPIVENYIASLTESALPVVKQTDPLYQKIVKNAHTYEVPPSDAKIDSVWKAIPGYNGIKVDIAASYKKMKKKGEFDKQKLVFVQTKPHVHLENLPPTPIYKGHPDKPMVSFIINVAWGNEYLSDILATLKKHNVSATFFLEGNWTKKNPELAKMIVSAGHEVGNHSYSHPDMSKLTAAKTREQMIKTNEIIEAATGEKCVWFAPPSGSYRDETVKIADELNMKTVMWTVDTVDWRKPSPEVLINRVISKIDKGSMVLMHPTESTAKSLDRLITLIEKKNLHIGTVSELMDEERIIK